MPKATPEAIALICGLRRLDPHVEVPRIAEVLERQTGIKLSETVIRRVLAAENLNRPCGAGKPPASPQPERTEEVLFGGAVLLGLMDEATGYTREMAKAIAEVHTRPVAASQG